MSLSARGTQKQQRVTIEHVARLAGVSTTTVSNVLNGRTDAMTAATLARVIDATRVLQYQPNQVARSLATRQTATIGLIISEINTALFFGAVSTIERVARGAGYNVLLCHASSAVEEREAIGVLQQRDVEGVVFLSTSDHRDNAHLALLGPSVPVVAINRADSGHAHDSIAWDNVGGIASAVRHLHRMGHRQIAHVRGPLNRQGTEERLRGYRLGLEECGIAFRDEYVVSGDYTGDPADWQAATEQLLSQPARPTAVIASDDSVAAVVIRTLQRHGLRVPDDVAVIGVDDQPFARFLNPALTTLRLPVAEAGELAITTVVDRLKGGSGGPQRLVLPTTLVIRESCGGKPQDFGDIASSPSPVMSEVTSDGSLADHPL